MQRGLSALTVALFVGAVLVFSVVPVFGQVFPPGCGSDAKEFAQFLGDKYGERPLWSGVPENPNGDAREGFKLYGCVNPDTGSWTVFAVNSIGQYCIAQTGRGFKPDGNGP